MYFFGKGDTELKIIWQICIVLFICLIGEYVSSLLPITFPSSVISMIILFVLLVFGFLKSHHIKNFSDFLLNNMSFFFIPASVAIMDKYSILKENLLPIVIICLVSTIVTFVCTALAVNIVTNFTKAKKSL